MVDDSPVERLGQSSISTEPNYQIGYRELIAEAKIAGQVSELIQGIVRRQAIAQAVDRAGIEITDAEIQIAADLFRSNNQLETSEATWKWLKDRFLSVEDLERIIIDRLNTDKLAHHLFADEVERCFYQNILDYSGAIIYEVVLEDRNLAMEIFYSLEEGDLSFADVAHQYITDPELKRRGGYLGKIDRKQLRPEISAAVFAAKPPQLIKPIVTKVGVHLIHVEEILQPQLDSVLYQQILMNLFEQWLEQQVATIYPQILLEL